MTLLEMQNRVCQYSKMCEKRFVGGEVYFNELDRLIKCDTELLCNYMLYIACQENTRNFVCSGEIGKRILKCKHKRLLPENFNIVVLNGGLRLGKRVVQLNSAKTNGNYIFVDDSLYSGKTLRAAKEYLNQNGAEIAKCYVFYDGSLSYRSDVSSLYRYYKTN